MPLRGELKFKLPNKMTALQQCLKEKLALATRIGEKTLFDQAAKFNLLVFGLKTSVGPEQDENEDEAAASAVSSSSSSSSSTATVSKKKTKKRKKPEAFALDEDEAAKRMKEWVVLSLQHQHFQSALKELKETYRTDPTKKAEEASKMLRELVAAKNTPKNMDDMTDTVLHKHAIYKEYQRMCGHEVEDEDEDDEINLDSDQDEDDAPTRPTRKRIPKKCPITQLAMEDPYETPCGHIFSKLGLFSMLKKKQVIKCPQSGCTGQNVRKSTIKPVDTHQQDKAKSQFMETFFGASQASQ